MTTKEIADWIREWFKEHTSCRELNSMYKDFVKSDGFYAHYDYVGKLTTLIWGMDPLEYMSYIPNWMFLGCKDITSIVIPNNITRIDSGAFIGCTRLTSVTIPNSVESIGEGAFIDCSSLTTISIPNSVTVIRDDMFRGCSNLKDVTIPDSVTRICHRAFCKCSSLTDITIPDSVTSIEDYTFTECKSLKHFKFMGTVKQWEKVQVRVTAFIEVPEVKIICSDGIITLK